MLKHPAVVLHELAHAYHDQVLGGFDEPRQLMGEEGLCLAFYEQLWSNRRWRW